MLVFFDSIRDKHYFNEEVFKLYFEINNKELPQDFSEVDIFEVLNFLKNNHKKELHENELHKIEERHKKKSETLEYVSRNKNLLIESKQPNIPILNNKNINTITKEVYSNFTEEIAVYGFPAVHVSDQIKKERLDICQKCDKYSNENPENPTCNECGCFLNIKTAWASESCPLKKWSAIATQSSGGCGGCGSK